MEITKVWSKEKLKELLQTSDEMVRRGLLVVFALQTSDEKRDENTRYLNGVGFNGTDSVILSSFARQLKEKGYLSPKQIALARKKLIKYASQMAKVANGEIFVDEKDLVYKK
jgi:hypothetical protein